MKLRLIEGRHSCDMNMAIDDALMQEFKGNPVLRIYGWNPPAVSIGYFQNLVQEVDTKECNRCGIGIVRRMTGGGAVFHDDEMTYSLIIPIHMAPSDIKESYQFICQPIIDALNSLGIISEFKPLNDIIVAGKKISGNAQTRKGKNLLQHGTILLSFDAERMFSVLKVPDEKSRYKAITNVKERLVSITDIVGKVHISKAADSIRHSLCAGFSRLLKLPLEEDLLTDEEASLAKDLSAKYQSKKWNYLR